MGCRADRVVTGVAEIRKHGHEELTPGYRVMNGLGGASRERVQVVGGERRMLWDWP